MPAIHQLVTLWAPWMKIGHAREVSASPFERRLRIALDETARGAAICLHRHERLTADFDSAEKASHLGRTRGPGREEDVTMPSVGSIAALHELFALRALRTEIGHEGSRPDQEFVLCLTLKLSCKRAQ